MESSDEVRNMQPGSLSNRKLLCYLIALVFFILVLLLVPLNYIDKGIYNFVSKEEKKQHNESILSPTFSCRRFAVENGLKLVEANGK